MKPRLECAPYTQEDWDIWYVWLWKPPFKVLQLMTLSQPQDRRDADLMLAHRCYAHILAPAHRTGWSADAALDLVHHMEDPYS